MPPSKADQTAEGNNRAQITPQVPVASAAEMAAAMATPTDDFRSEALPVEQQPAKVEAQGEEAPRMPTPRRDSKRDEIAARHREQRNTEAEDTSDEISEFARSGLPQEFAPQPEPEEVIDEQQQEAPIEAQPEPQPQKRKLKIRGEEKEYTEEEIIAAAQKSLAGESYLDEGRSKLAEIDRLLSDTRTRATHQAQPGIHPAEQNVVQPGEQQPAEADPQHPEEDALAKAVELIQYGDPTEARTYLDKAVEERATRVASQVVQTSLQSRLVQDEVSRSQRQLADFEAQHPELSSDPMARAVIERTVYDLQVEDLKNIGFDPSQHGLHTPAQIAQAHLQARVEGRNVRQPGTLLGTATETFQTWRGPQPKAADAQPTDPNPQPEPQPRVQVRVERDQRRQAIPQQPSRSAAPRPVSSQPAAPQVRDRSAIVQDMKARRGLARGQITA